MPCDMRKYPADWKEIRERILRRAGYRCEGCRKVCHHAVGYRDTDGQFHPNRGNILCDYSGWGEAYRENRRLTFAEAQEFVDQYNDCTDPETGICCDGDGNHWFVVMLTIAHLNHDTADNRDENLKALCQQCHNRYDIPFRKANLRAKRMGRKAVGSLFEEVPHA
ncbi:MAG: hypothetical protein SFU56_19435 [Capsulimonadales bacterium]|nr:hypothetical protein [Capsulimonadales bacterium]